VKITEAAQVLGDFFDSKSQTLGKKWAWLHFGLFLHKTHLVALPAELTPSAIKILTTNFHSKFFRRVGAAARSSLQAKRRIFVFHGEDGS
jgi:hypothetical protein